jgi:hypothetical protein
LQSYHLGEGRAAKKVGLESKVPRFSRAFLLIWDLMGLGVMSWASGPVLNKNKNLLVKECYWKIKIKEIKLFSYENKLSK